MPLLLEPYSQQNARWPQSGRHIMAQYDAASIMVYQAYRPAIGRYALENQRFGGEFSFNRMSWIKPNFLWMMYRCGWATKPDQEIVLGIRLKREGFGQILAAAVHASYVPEVYPDQDAWKSALATSDVRLQWDPDHSPTGEPLNRRAIQLGMRGQILRQYATDWLIEIVDVTPLALEQSANIRADRRSLLQLPREAVYPIADPNVARRLGADEIVSDSLLPSAQPMQ